jgi:hypothetical protein
MDALKIWNQSKILVLWRTSINMLFMTPGYFPNVLLFHPGQNSAVLEFELRASLLLGSVLPLEPHPSALFASFTLF